MGSNKLRIDRIGEIRENRYGSKMKLIDYNKGSDVMVEFLDKPYRVYTTYQHFKDGCVVSIYDRTVCGVGYIGDIMPNNYNKEYSYKIWHDILHRCYDPKKKEKLPTYIDCSVCEEWHSYSNFKKWFDKNYYELPTDFNERTELDKDILIKGNKIYSPSTCIFVPRKINTLFTKRKADRGNTPIGVHYRYGRYETVLSATILGKTTTTVVGIYKTAEEAFLAYKDFKENYIKQVADYYKQYIPQKLYNALYNYQVEITD